METLIELPNYYEVDALNHSLLKEFDKTPFHYLAAKNTKLKPTEAMEFGTLVHGILLEDYQIGKEVIIDLNANKNTKTYKEWYAAQDKTKLIVNQESWNVANQMISNLLKKKSFNDFYKSEIEKEKAIYFTKNGYACKAKIDILAQNFIIDIKTVNDLNDKAIFNSIINYNYHSQLAWYCNAAGGYKPCYIVAIEKSAPYDSKIFKVPKELIDMGYNLNKKRFEMFTYCNETGDWFGYEDKPHDLMIPTWFRKELTILGDNVL